jgi:aspartyl protease family protein
MGYLIALIFAAAAVLVFVLPRDTFIAGMEPGQFIANAAYGLFAVVLAASLIHRYRGRFGAALRDIAIWVLLAAGLLTIYAYRDALAPIGERIMAELSPGKVVTSAPGVAEVVRRRGGDFVIEARANGRPLLFVFDTGASSVVLRAEDARRIGIDVSKLAYLSVVSTANGVARAAETTIDSLSVGTITQRRVRALVAQPGALMQSLLGQSFLGKLDSYSVEKDRLVLRGRADP